MQKFFVLQLVFVTYVTCGTEVKIPVGRLKEIADYVNALGTTWKARTDFTNESSIIDLSYMVGEQLYTPAVSEYMMYKSDSDARNNKNLPKNFDARKYWPKCKSIAHIYDQGHCGSCWAVSVLSAFTDRICIKSKGKQKLLRSVQQTLSCCSKCFKHDGCKGGKSFKVWRYLKENGAVTGGDYNSKQGCQPYLIQPCAHHVNGTKLPRCKSLKKVKAPKCKSRHCHNKEYNKDYKHDRIKIKDYYALEAGLAQNEIYKDGPIVTSMAVYEDFVTYKSGVYAHTTGKFRGFHAVRVIGWGVEKNTPYWLVANSWNKDWGDQGTFKILRGNKRHLSFELKFHTGIVDL